MESVSAISATTGFTLKSTIKVDSGSSLTDFTKSGDAIGVILTGASKAQLAANAQSSQATNDGLELEVCLTQFSSAAIFILTYPTSQPVR